MKRVTIAVVDGVFDSGLSLIRDALNVALQLGTRREHQAKYRLELGTVDGEPVRTMAGVTIDACGPLPPKDETDFLIVPGFFANDERDVTAYLRRERTGAVVEYLRTFGDCQMPLAAGCTGTFLLAEAGLLDHKRATTTWWLADHFRRRYPEVRLEVTKMLVEDKRLLTSGAVMSHMDLALAIVERLTSPGLSDALARLLLLDGRASQARYMVTEHLGRMDPDVLAAEAWIRAHIADPFAVPDVARAVGLSPRSLARRFRQATTLSPLRFIQRVRVEQAIHLLATTELAVERVAELVGHRNVGAFRRVFQRETGRVPSAYRSRRTGGNVG